MRGSSKKKWAVLLTVSALCMSAAVPMSPVMAAETTESQGVVSVRTTQRCSIWSAPATTEENRVKYVDAGYQIQVYPQVIESVLGDGKTFYRTVKGAYVLARCVTGAEGGAAETPAASDGQMIEPLMPYGDMPVVEVGEWEYGDRLYEYWYQNADGWYYIEGLQNQQPIIETDGYGITYRAYFDYNNRDCMLVELGEWNYENWGEPSEEDREFYAKWAHYCPNSILELVADIAAEDPAIGNFLSEHGKQILFCFTPDNYVRSHPGPGVDNDPDWWAPVYSWIWTVVQCHRGGEPTDCVCIMLGEKGAAAYTFGDIKNALTSVMNGTTWN